MDLTTTYLGMELRTPLVASASPLSEEIDSIRRMEDAGISAVVLHSLFEEQLVREQFDIHARLSEQAHGYAEAPDYLPEPSEWRLGPEEYLEHVRRAKEAVNVPIIASLNGSSLGGWVEYATEIEVAGADALELNIYSVPTRAELTGVEVEQEYIDIVRAVKSAVIVPVAVKLSPFFSSMANMAVRLEAAGADGLVLFNRFYQPDIDLETLEVVPNLLLSTPQALRLPLRWVALLRGQVDLSLAATSGVHWAHDVIKMLLVGADATMLCSTLLRHGVETIGEIEAGLAAWLETREYESVRQMQGSMSQRSCPDPTEFERAQYIKTLHSYRFSGVLVDRRKKP
jgi:dihydroorotate dehydrogenase (fumarate)